MGYVLQHGGLFPHLTAEGNVLLMRAGKIEQTGSMEDLVETPASEFVGDFLRAQRGLHI